MISVIIPVYNAKNTIEICLLSVIKELRLNLCKWEIIIIDDGSSDNTLEIIYSFIKENSLESFIKVLSQSNQGAGAARTKGIIEAKGDYIAFNDSDDEWLEGKIQTQLEVFERNPEIVMVGGLHDQDRLSFLWKKAKYLNEISLYELLCKFYFTTPGVMFKKQILEKVRYFNPYQRNAEEGLFFYRMVYYGRCILVKKVFSKNIEGKKSWGQNGLSGQIHKQSKGELSNIKAIYSEGLIGFLVFILAYSFSLFKYLLRIVKFYKIKLNEA